MKAAYRVLATQHETRDRRLIGKLVREQLVHADRSPNHAPALQGDAREDVAGAAGVTAARIAIEEAMDHVELLLVRFERSEAGAEFQRRSLPLGPPVGRRNAVSLEQAGEPQRRRRAIDRLRTPGAYRFQPGKGHGNTETLEHGPSRNVAGVHRGTPWFC